MNITTQQLQLEQHLLQRITSYTLAKQTAALALMVLLMYGHRAGIHYLHVPFQSKQL